MWLQWCILHYCLSHALSHNLLTCNCRITSYIIVCRLTGFPFTNMPRSSSSVEPFQLRGLHSQQKLNPGNYSQWKHPKKSIIGKAKKIQRRSIFALAIISVKQFSQLLMTFVKGFAKTSPEIIQQPCAWECHNSWDILCWPRVSWIGRENTRGCIEGVTCYKQASAWEALHWFLVRKADIGAEMRDRCKCDSE